MSCPNSLLLIPELLPSSLLLQPWALPAQPLLLEIASLTFLSPLCHYIHLFYE